MGDVKGSSMVGGRGWSLLRFTLGQYQFGRQRASAREAKNYFYFAEKSERDSVLSEVFEFVTQRGYPFQKRR
jgi:hypothetical protein